MISAIIIDDEKNNIKNLEGLLHKHCPEVQIVASAFNAEQGCELINQFKPELIFLDIQMPGKNGFDMLQSLSHRDFEVVFVTAFDQFGIQAIKFSAIDYLLKPVNSSELVSAVEKANTAIIKKNENTRLENLINLLQNRQHKNVHRLALPTSKETKFVTTEDIIRCESSNSYTSFFLTGGDKIIVSKPIFEYEELLKDYGFIRCHQSHLVNISRVSSFLKEDGGYLLLNNGNKIPVSRSKKDIVLKELVSINDK